MWSKRYGAIYGHPPSDHSIVHTSIIPDSGVALVSFIKHISHLKLIPFPFLSLVPKCAALKKRCLSHILLRRLKIRTRKTEKSRLILWPKVASKCLQILFARVICTVSSNLQLQCNMGPFDKVQIKYR